MGNEIDNIIDLIDRDNKFFGKIKRNISMFFIYHKSWLIVPILFIGIIFLGLLVNSIEYPYVEYEFVKTNVPYEEVVKINSLKPIEVIEKVEILVPVNYSVSQRILKNVSVNECNKFKPEFTFEYAGNLRKITARTYDYKAGWGYNNGYYQQNVKFCTNEPKEFWIEYEICRFYDLKIIDCENNDRIFLKPNSCNEASLFWKTLFDKNKDIKIKINRVSEIEKCGQTNKEIEVGKRSDRIKRGYDTRYEYLTKVKNISVIENKSIIKTKEVIQKKEVIKKKPILYFLFDKIFT